MSIIDKINKYENILEHENVPYEDKLLIKNKFKKILTKIQEKKNNYITMFNDISIGLCNMLYEKYPTTINKLSREMFIKIIKDNKNDPINMFFDNVYVNEIHRNSILDGSYFKNIHSIKIDNEIFVKCKSYWSELNNEYRHYIEQSIKTMIEITSEYIISINHIFRINSILDKCE